MLQRLLLSYSCPSLLSLPLFVFARPARSGPRWREGGGKGHGWCRCVDHLVVLGWYPTTHTSQLPFTTVWLSFFCNGCVLAGFLFADTSVQTALLFSLSSSASFLTTHYYLFLSLSLPLALTPLGCLKASGHTVYVVLTISSSSCGCVRICVLICAVLLFSMPIPFNQKRNTDSESDQTSRTVTY